MVQNIGRGAVVRVLLGGGGVSVVGAGGVHVVGCFESVGGPSSGMAGNGAPRIGGRKMIKYGQLGLEHPVIPMTLNDMAYSTSIEMK